MMLTEFAAFVAGESAPSLRYSRSRGPSAALRNSRQIRCSPPTGRGVELGRGLARCSSTDAVLIARKRGEGADERSVLVHRDDLVVW